MITVPPQCLDFDSQSHGVFARIPSRQLTAICRQAWHFGATDFVRWNNRLAAFLFPCQQQADGFSVYLDARDEIQHTCAISGVPITPRVAKLMLNREAQDAAEIIHAMSEEDKKVAMASPVAKSLIELYAPGMLGMSEADKFCDLILTTVSMPSQRRTLHGKCRKSLGQHLFRRVHKLANRKHLYAASTFVDRATDKPMVCIETSQAAFEKMKRLKEIDNDGYWVRQRPTKILFRPACPYGQMGHRGFEQEEQDHTDTTPGTTRHISLGGQPRHHKHAVRYNSTHKWGSIGFLALYQGRQAFVTCAHVLNFDKGRKKIAFQHKPKKWETVSCEIIHDINLSKEKLSMDIAIVACEGGWAPLPIPYTPARLSFMPDKDDHIYIENAAKTGPARRDLVVRRTPRYLEYPHFMTRKPKRWLSLIQPDEKRTIKIKPAITCDLCSEPGDSGTAVRRTSDDAIIGLVCGGDKSPGWQETYIIPVFPYIDQLSLPDPPSTD